MSSSYYIFAVLGRDTAIPDGTAGFGEQPLLAVPWLRLKAAVSQLCFAALPPTPENVLLHEAVVEMLSAMGPALPLRFGTVFPDINAVQRVLAGQYETLLDDLHRVGDKIELGLTVLWDESGAGDGGDTMDTGTRAANGPGARYLALRLAEHRQTALALGRGRMLAHEIDHILSSGAIERRFAVLPTSRLLLRADYLLERASVAPFRQAFEATRRAYPRLRFLLSGPWPPYSFVAAPREHCKEVC